MKFCRRENKGDTFKSLVKIQHALDNTNELIFPLILVNEPQIVTTNTNEPIIRDDWGEYHLFNKKENR